MKSQSIKKILAALILLLSPLTMLAEEAYAVYTESNTTLTFYYDNLRNTRPGTKYDLNSLNYPGWWRDDNYANVTNVVFDSSFRDARPTSTWCWFYDMTNLASIQGMKEYLNTSEVTDMRAMFEDCSSLTSLDVSGFNTENVTTMYCMFAGCSSLTSLDVSGFKTDNVMDMMDMFYKCSKIENLDVSGFNTAKVKFMVEMFHSCESLTSLDVSGFNTATVTDMDGMFGYCSGLTNIYCNDNWNKSGLSSTDMFKSCLNLKGGNGTVYNSSYTDATYAHPDAAGNPGYFTQPPYAALDGTTLTFYCDGKRSTRTTTFDLNSGYNFPGWYSPTSSITQVTFDASFQNARPTSTCSWFNGMKNLTSITGMKEYLNTSEVKIMSWMFDDCSGLTSLDVSAFNTAKVTSMYSMFYGCSSLTSLDVSGFNTAKVTSMDGMFSYCSNLKTIYCNDNWNKSGLSSTDMFKSCLKLNGGKGTTYSSSHTDATYAHPDAAGNPGYFTQPPYAALDGTTLTFYFDGKRSTRTTTYDLNSGTNDPGWYTDGKYARVTKVVFDYSFMYARPTSTYHWFYGMRNLTSIQGMKLYLNTSETMYGMFYNCSSLTSLDVSGFNTENVTDMSWMFRSCSSLTSLDVRNFKTTAVQYMDYMFYGCSSLETIYCNDDWNESNPTSARMFTRCESLKGGNGTAYNGNYTTATYAHPDVAGNRGYFSAMEAYAALSTDSKTLTFYYDGQRISRTGTTYLIPWTSDYPGWTSNTGNSTITTVNFDPSFDHYHGLTTTYDMFYGLRALTTINNLKYLHTENVTDMRRMFQNCSSLTSLDVSGFNTEKVTYMMYMFSDCSSLTTIYCDKNWDRIWGLYSTGMFFGCESLVGGKGTVYNYENTYADYAHPDGGTENPGYFSMSYAVLSTDGTTLTFYYDGQRNTREGTTYYLNTGATTPGWNTTTQRPYITTVVFDASFQYARPTSTYWWFYLMTALNSITGMKENLNTSQVTNMNGMFGYCSGLTSLDLSGFNTENVTTMSGMFASCSNLTSLDVSSFNTENVTAMNSMFGSCSKLTSLDVSSFNTENVTNMSSMFYNCSSLETICCNDDWNESNPTSTRMFFGCSSLVGGKGTAYNSSYITATYAHPDGGTDNQGYFSAKEAYAVLSTDNKTLTFYYDGQRNKREGTTYDLNGASSNPAWYSKRSYITTVVFDASFQYARPTSTYSWFYGMGNLTSITGMKENLNTSQVTTMRQMFRGCSSLTSLDVSGFNTENVTNHVRHVLQLLQSDEPRRERFQHGERDGHELDVPWLLQPDEPRRERLQYRECDGHECHVPVLLQPDEPRRERLQYRQGDRHAKHVLQLLQPDEPRRERFQYRQGDKHGRDVRLLLRPDKHLL